MDRAIELRHVGKRFTKYEDTPMLVTTALRLRPRTRRRRLWAVRGVDLEVADGESFGIIGRNGSGKSTLMTLMAGITAPSEGSVRVAGRVAPLISVGVGFHRELTGRENVYVNGSILGLSRTQIDRRLEEIIAFAEIDGFVDTPVKFYSSGMFVRLGFAVAVHADPDVLLVDEVLAVGDLAFQMKCFDKMTEIRRRGTTVVMVSHHLAAVRRMCGRVLLMDAGRPRFLGSTEEAIAALHQLLSTQTETQVDHDSGTRFEPGVVEVAGLEVAGGDGRPTAHVAAGEPMTVTLAATAVVDVPDLVVGLTVFAPDGTPVYADSTVGRPLGAVGAGETLTCTMALRAQLPTGSYTVTGRVERPDLRTTVALTPPASFFVTGRNTVAGLADLEAVITRVPAPAVAEAAVGAGEGRP